MSDTSNVRRIMMVAGGITVLAGMFFLFSWWRSSGSSRPVGPPAGPALAATMPAGKEVVRSVPAPTKGSEAARPTTQDALPADVPLAGKTVADLVDKGFPRMTTRPHPAYLRIKDQTTEEVVADLGDSFTREYTRSVNVTSDRRALHYWASSLPKNLKVVRLIQEGREDPQLVTCLVQEQLDLLLESYDQEYAKYKDYQAKWSRGDAARPCLSENDAYYAEHRKYDNPVIEFIRINEVIQASFYILANLDQLRANSLASWFGKDTHAQFKSIDMNVWEIDAYFLQPQNASSAGATQHASLMGGKHVAAEPRRVSTWNALRDIDHAPLRQRNVDVSDIPTVEVLGFPDMMEINDTVKQQVVMNFMEHIASSR